MAIPVLSPAQERKRFALERRLRAVLKDAEQLAIEAGCDPEDVNLYFESGATFYVMNGEPHDGYNDRSHPERAVFSLYCLGAVRSIDCGAW